jgi:alkylresorcinol/alkylpyrone synthase
MSGRAQLRAEEPDVTPRASLIALATASPPHVLDQVEVTSAAREVFEPRLKDFSRLESVFANAGIVRRQSVRPMAWHRSPRTWPERTAVYLEEATDLFVEAARAALAIAGLRAGDVDAVVSVSSTGIATPSLEALAMGRLGLRADVARTPVFGLGCAGGVSGLGLAARLAQARPGSVVLFVCVELCTLSARHDELTSANIVATALFGDGAAAAVLTTGAGGLQVEASAEHTWPDTLEIMGWRIDPQGFGVIFDRSIPGFAAANLRRAMDAMLTAMGVRFHEVGRFVFHPGGARVVDAMETALELAPGTLDVERDVLRDHGNMSAPTALFVLERVLARPAPPGRLVLAALGPGFTASCVALSS